MANLLCFQHLKLCSLYGVKTRVGRNGEDLEGGGHDLVEVLSQDMLKD